MNSEHTTTRGDLVTSIMRTGRKVLPRPLRRLFNALAQCLLLPHSFEYTPDTELPLYTKQEIAPAESYADVKPYCLQPLPPAYSWSRVDFPKLFAYMVPSGAAFRTFLLDRQRHILPEVTQQRLFQHLQMHYSRRLRSTAPRHWEGMLISLTNTYMDNYHHWLHDLVAQLLLLAPDDNSRLLAPLERPYEYSSLNMLGIGDERIIRQMPFGLDAADMVVGFKGHSPLTGHPACVRALATLPARAKALSTGCKRLFISRGDIPGRRNIRNEREISAYLGQYGFKTVTLSGMPFSEQVALFHQAEAVILAHGAALSNLSFCRPGTRVLELVSPCYHVPIILTFATALRLNFHICIGIDAEMDKQPDSANYSIDMTLFAKAFEAFMADGAWQPFREAPAAHKNL